MQTDANDGETDARGAQDHVCICIPTYRRPAELHRLLLALANLETSDDFTYSVLVVDNDPMGSARATLEAVAQQADIKVSLVHAPRKNVAIARNAAVDNAVGTLIAFIDDDEVPTPTWLVRLYECVGRHNVAGALGPVRPVFESAPPPWVLQARVFDRPSYSTGTRLDWTMTRTGNALLRRSLFAPKENRFNPQFTHSEDRDFFRRMIAAGHVFVWCDEAPVYETETTDRFRRRYHLRRALVRGNAAMRHHGYGTRRIAKSVVALAVYSTALPLAALGGQARFMTYCVKICDHVGGLMALAGIDLLTYSGGA